MKFKALITPSRENYLICWLHPF